MYENQIMKSRMSANDRRILVLRHLSMAPLPMKSKELYDEFVNNMPLNMFNYRSWQRQICNLSTTGKIDAEVVNTHGGCSTIIKKVT